MSDSHDDGAEYRIEFTLQRCLPGEDDFSDIGFGSSGAWDSPATCAHMISSDIDNDIWETEPGMPDPSSIRAALDSAVR